MAAYAGQPRIDLWVAPPGADNLIRGSFSAQLPLSLVDSIRATVGVVQADPLIKAFLPVRTSDSAGSDRTVTLLAIGYRTPSGLGGPPSFAEGIAPSGTGEIALDRAAAHRLDVVVGDTVLLAGVRAIVSGLTRGTNILATQFLFADFEAAATGVGIRLQASLIPVQLAGDADVASVARDLEERLPDIHVYTRDTFVAANEREVISGIVPLLTLIAALGIGAACILVGVLVLNVVDERRAEIAVLVALGARLPTVSLGIVAYAAKMVALGIVLGVGIAYGMSLLFDHLLPTIPLAFSATDTLVISLLFAGAGMGTAVVPVAHLRKIDPLEAFRP
jgi:ABC-type antimicrobial peptide transport system permease subunit